MAFSGTSFNGFIREYFSDIAGITSKSKSVNDSMRAGLEQLGYSGSLSKMLRQWADANASAGTSVNSALRALMAEMQGEAGTSIGSMMSEYAGVTWDTILTPWEDEHRLWNYID